MRQEYGNSEPAFGVSPHLCLILYKLGRIMAKIANNLTELIGGTPLMKLAGYSRKYGLQREVVAKLESFNPAGSVKDRVGLAMIEDAEARGALKPGATIIEPTSGNTGVGLAMVATIKGYHLILTMPETMSIERRNLLKALGAEIVLTDGLAGMAGSIAKAQELRDRIPGAVILQQFENPSNARIHELTTGEEIWTDTDGQVDKSQSRQTSGIRTKRYGCIFKSHDSVYYGSAGRRSSGTDTYRKSGLQDQSGNAVRNEDPSSWKRNCIYEKHFRTWGSIRNSADRGAEISESGSKTKVKRV